VMILLQELGRAGITIVLVTHEADIAEHAGRCIVLKDGRILSDTRRVPRRAEILVGWEGTEAETQPVARNPL
jgi:putative ABC transport system ATP-binding protein